MVAGDVDGSFQHPPDIEHHRANPQRLLGDCVEVLVTLRIAGGAGLGGLHCSGQHGRMAGQALQRPGQAGRRGVMTGDKQRHQLVAQLRIGHRAAVLIGGTHQHCQGVGARGQVGVGAPVGDLGVEQAVGFGDTAPDTPPAAGTPTGSAAAA